ncbi:MAG: hypothetical protein ABIH92_04225 [Nanoarchaeota archaeon]
MKKRGLVLLAVALILVFFSIQLKADDVPTDLEVYYNNTAPVLSSPIPNQTWTMNTNLTNAFDLDDYFSDVETLTYNNTDVTNITVTINGTTNLVSFYPDYGFEGIRNVTFSAYDGFVSADSNVVSLNVTEDNIPPTWSNPRILNVTRIAQNDVVNFTAAWQDNLGLGYFILSLNQGSGWVGQTAVTFTGTQNNSNDRVQISAAGGSLVYWKIYGYDLAGNLNVTDEQSFRVYSPPAPPQEEDSGRGRTTSSSSTLTGTKKEISDFTVTPSSFSLKLRQGSTITITIKVSNTGSKNLSFNTIVSGLEGIYNLVERGVFNLSSGKSKTVTIEFSADERLSPDIYYGNILVSTSEETKDIPTAITVKSSETDFDLVLIVPEEYKNVRTGEIVKANITLQNLKDISEDLVTFYYAVSDFQGEILNSGSEEFTFTEKYMYFERELIVPESTIMGEYIFFARAVNGEAIAIDSDVFEVGRGFTVWGFIRTNLFILLIIVASVMVALLMVRHHRNKERLRLLNLYILITQLKKLMKEGKIDRAINIYIRIKSAYGQPVSKTTLQNKDELKKEIEKLTQKVLNPQLATIAAAKVEGTKKPEEKPATEKPKENAEKPIAKPKTQSIETKKASPPIEKEEIRKPTEKSLSKTEDKKPEAEKKEEAPKEKKEAEKPAKDQTQNKE